MNRILEAVYNTARNDETKTQIESTGGHLTVAIDKGHDSIASTFADWLELSARMDAYNSGKTVVEARTSYPVTNICNLWHNQLYGNRTLAEAQLEERLEFPNNAYCSYQNVKVREQQYEAVKDEEDGMQGPSAEKDTAFLNKEEAVLWNAYCLANYHAACTLFEEIFAMPFVYKPYDQKPRTIAGSANAKRLAEERKALLAKRAAGTVK